MLKNPWVILGAVILLLAVYGLGYGMGNSHGRATIQARWDAQKELDRKAQDAKQAQTNLEALALAKELADARNKIAELTEELNDEIDHNPIYTSCVVPKSGVLLYNR